MDGIHSTASNEFIRRMGWLTTEIPEKVQEFSDEELLAIKVTSEHMLERMRTSSTDYGSHDFGKALRSVLAKMGQ